MADPAHASAHSAAPRWSWLAYAALLAWTAYRYSAGISPPALGQDDLWVGFLVKHATLADLLVYEAPVPMGFIAAQQLVFPWIADPEVTLQIVPFVCSLILVALAGWTGTRLTGRWELGFLSAVLIVLHPESAAYAVRVKQFTWDAATTLALFATSIRRLDPDEPSRPFALAISAMIALLFSFNSIFLGLMLCHTHVLLTWGNRRAFGRSAAAAFSFDLFALALYVFRLEPQSAEWVVQYWTKWHAFPAATPSIAAGVDFEWLARALRRAYTDWLIPQWLALVVAAPIGLAALFAKRRTRWVGFALLGVFVALPLAALLRFYPFGGGRTDYFFQPLLAVLAATGVGAAAQWLAGAMARGGRNPAWGTRARTALPLALVAAILALGPWKWGRYGSGTMTTELKDLVATLDAQTAQDGFIWMSRPSRWNVGYYTKTPLRVTFANPEGKLFDFEMTGPRSEVIVNVVKELEERDLPDRITFVGILEGRHRLRQFERRFRKAGYVMESHHLTRKNGSAIIEFVRPTAPAQP